VSIHDDHQYSDPSPWMNDVRPGDRLRLDPYWNATSGPSNRLPDVVEVAEVEAGANSHSGVAFTLRATDPSGRPWKLDAAWFLGPEGP
jgi:hypothetical protein